MNRNLGAPLPWNATKTVALCVHNDPALTLIMDDYSTNVVGTSHTMV